MIAGAVVDVAEVGSASAMAAAAAVEAAGGTPRQSSEAFAMALGNLLGLVCDPVAGLVEIPCVKRNTVGAGNALIAADMALAGIVNKIPADEVVEAMNKVGRQLPRELRETGLGGLAGTATGQRMKNEILKSKIHHCLKFNHEEGNKMLDMKNSPKCRSGTEKLKHVVWTRKFYYAFGFR